MLVSVIVPVFNGARFLRECLDSLVAQDYSPLEIVVVDDGSTDGSAEIADSFEGVRVLRRPHEGLGTTRNAGVVLAQGQLIAWCDSDDTCCPEKVRVQVEYLEAHPEIDIVLCRHETIFEPGVSRPTWLLPDQVRGDLDGVALASGLFRREVFSRVGFRTDMDVGTDFDLLVNAQTAGCDIAVLEDVLRSRRIHDDNMTTRGGGNKAGMFQTVREHLRSLPR